MPFTACTIVRVNPNHNPNEGRNIINDNFSCLESTIEDIQVSSATGTTIVDEGTNIGTNLSFSGLIPIYQVHTVDSPSFDGLSASGSSQLNEVFATSLSGGTLYSGATDISDLFAMFIPGGTNYGSQFTLTGTGTNSYAGTATPTLTAYSTSDIYLTQFENSNTTTAVTLDISSLGVLDVLKGTESGLTSLEISEIQTGVTYFLTYDGSGFQFFDSNPEGTAGTYTNLSPSTSTLGGVVAGTTFSAATWQSVFDTMFYPTLVPSFTSFVMRASPSTATTQSQTLEVGNSVSGGTRVFTWGTTNSAFVSTNTVKIYNVNSGNAIITTPTSGITNANQFVSIPGLANVQKVTPTSHTWRIYATRTNSSTFNMAFTANWYWRRMYGVSTATTITTSESVYAFSGTGSMTNTIVGTYSFTGAGYKYFFVPTSFASPSLFKDASTQLAVAMADVTDEPFFSGTSGSYSFGTTSVTNQFNVAQAYRIYRTRNLLNGNINIVVS